MKRLTIKVTKKDIEKGKPTREDACPIACALKRMGKVHPDVQEDIIYFEEKGGKRLFCFYPTKKVQKFIADFDSETKKVKPFTFQTLHLREVG